MKTIKNAAQYKILKTVSMISCRKKDMRITYHYSRRELKDKQVVILGNHASYDSFFNFFYDFDFPDQIVPFVGFVHPRDPIMGRFLRLFEHILKRMYVVTDLSVPIKMMRAIKEGKSLLIFPEGTNSYCGLCHPVNPVIGGALKNMGKDVILACSKGEYLSNPRYTQDKKAGPVEIDYYHLFTPKALKEKSEQEVYDELMAQFLYNDFKWNAQHCNKYLGKERNAIGLEKVIYRCPCCGEEGHLFTKEDCIICDNCENTIRMDDTYAIEPASKKDVLPYSRVDEWFYDQRRLLRKEIRENENYSIKLNVTLNILNEIDRKSMFRPVGKGTIEINRKGVTYEGEKEGEKIGFTISINGAFGASNQKNRYMVMFHGKETVVFDFGDNQEVPIVKACSAIEEFHALVNPVWDKALIRVFS